LRQQFLGPVDRAGDLRVKELLVGFLRSHDLEVRQAAATALATLAVEAARAAQPGAF